MQNIPGKNMTKTLQIPKSLPLSRSPIRVRHLRPIKNWPGDRLSLHLSEFFFGVVKPRLRSHHVGRQNFLLKLRTRRTLPVFRALSLIRPVIYQIVILETVVAIVVAVAAVFSIKIVAIVGNDWRKSSRLYVHRRLLLTGAFGTQTAVATDSR